MPRRLVWMPGNMTRTSLPNDAGLSTVTRSFPHLTTYWAYTLPRGTEPLVFEQDVFNLESSIRTGLVPRATTVSNLPYHRKGLANLL